MGDPPVARYHRREDFGFRSADCGFCMNDDFAGSITKNFGSREHEIRNPHSEIQIVSAIDVGK
jgi:hypothetical protein